MPNNFELPDEPTPYQGDPIYERQASLNLRSLSTQVFIVGCGGVGAWVALSLALAGIRRMTLYDGDTISIHNLNRFPLPPSAVGKLKSEALADWLMSLRPATINQMENGDDTQIDARGMFNPDLHTFLPDYSFTTGGFVICATDSLKSRKMVHEAAVRDGCFYLEVGAEGERWSLSPAPPVFSTELEEEPGYQTVPVHVGPCMMAGAAAAYYILHHARPTVSILGEWDTVGYPNLRIASMNEIGASHRPASPLSDFSREALDNLADELRAEGDEAHAQALEDALEDEVQDEDEVLRGNEEREGEEDEQAQTQGQEQP